MPVTQDRRQTNLKARTRRMSADALSCECCFTRCLSLLAERSLCSHEHRQDSFPRSAGCSDWAWPDGRRRETPEVSCQTSRNLIGQSSQVSSFAVTGHYCLYCGVGLAVEALAWVELNEFRKARPTRGEKGRSLNLKRKILGRRFGFGARRRRNWQSCVLGYTHFAYFSDIYIYNMYILIYIYTFICICIYVYVCICIYIFQDRHTFLSRPTSNTAPSHANMHKDNFLRRLLGLLVGIKII